MRDLVRLIVWAVVDLFRSRAAIEAEILTLRQQIIVLRRTAPKKQSFGAIDRLVFVGLYRLFPRVLDALAIVRPATVIKWHRAGFRLYWRWKSRPRGGRPPVLIRVAYGDVFIRRVRSMGIRDRPTSPRSPWQNGYAERLIGSIRRECLDHVVVFGECHLRHLLLSYLKYYNGARTHLSLEKEAPFSRAVELAGHILCRPILGGLHHQYVRI